MTGAALQPFVTSQRQEGVVGARLTSTHLRQWAWQAGPDAPFQGHLTATTAPRQRLSKHDQPNKLGSYYCWNRIYDVFMGRWTTPDPLSSPWKNVFEYTDTSPVQKRDETALEHMPSGYAIQVDQQKSKLLDNCEGFQVLIDILGIDKKYHLFQWVNQSRYVECCDGKVFFQWFRVLEMFGTQSDFADHQGAEWYTSDARSLCGSAGVKEQWVLRANKFFLAKSSLANPVTGQTYKVDLTHTVKQFKAGALPGGGVSGPDTIDSPFGTRLDDILQKGTARTSSATSYTLLWRAEYGCDKRNQFTHCSLRITGDLQYRMP